MTYLLDTCIVSKLRRVAKDPDPILLEWFRKHEEDHYFLSALTVGEIEKGIARLKDQRARRVLSDWLWGELVPSFEGRTIPVDTKVATKWGEMCGEHGRKGVVLPTIDSLIAATGMTHGLIVVTDNSKDFERISGLHLFNPWVDLAAV